MRPAEPVSISGKTVTVLGNGVVGTALAKGFSGLGYAVVFGTREVDGEKTRTALAAVPGSRAAPLAEAARAGSIAVTALPWSGLKAALLAAGPDNLAGKLVIDPSNPLDFSGGAPVLSVGYTDSAGELVQRLLPRAYVVKAFNTIYYEHLATRGRKDLPVEERHAIYLAGDEAAAKATVAGLIESIGFAPVDTGSLREGGRLQQPESPIYNQTFTAREARAFFRNELHKLTDVLPDAALLLALEALGQYKCWPSKS